MTEPNHQPTPDILEHATEALRDAPVAPLPGRLADAVSAAAWRRDRRRRVMRYIRYGSAATVAAGLLIAAGVLWLGSGSAEANFRRAMDNAGRAKSVRAVLRAEIPGKTSIERKLIRQGNFVRIDGSDNSIMTYDLETLDGLILNSKDKTFWRAPVAGIERQVIRGLMGSYSDLRKYLAGDNTKAIRPLKAESIGSRQMNVFEVIGPKVGDQSMIWKVWIDPKTELPVRAQRSYTENQSTVTVTLEYQTWDEKFDAKLFSLDVPKGYTVEGDKKPTPPESEPEAGPTQFILFRRVMDNADRAKSVRVIHKTNRYGKWATESTEYYQGDRVRAEVGVILVVVDGTAKKRLELNTATKTARLRDMTEPELREHKRQQLNWLTEPLQPLRHLQDDKDYTVRELPLERQNGRLVKVYQIDHTAGGKTDRRIKLSVDAKTELPIRAYIEGAKAETNPLSSDALMNRNRPPTTIIEYEDWNKEFDAKLFSLEVPKGYRLSDHPLRDTEPPPEETQFILFRRAMDDAEKAKSFRAVVHTTMTNAPAGAPKEIEQKLFSQGDKMRIEFGGTMVSVADATAKKMLLLNAKAKTAQTMPLNGPPSDLQKSVTAAVKKVLDRKKGTEDLGEKFLDGRKTHAYRVKGLSLGGMKADVTYWIDAKRNLPVRLEMKTTGPVTMTQSIDYLGFNEELDPELFEMVVPKGYKVIEKPK